MTNLYSRNYEQIRSKMTEKYHGENLGHQEKMGTHLRQAEDIWSFYLGMRDYKDISIIKIRFVVRRKWMRGLKA